MRVSKRFFSFFYLMFTSIFFVWVSLYKIKNPDLEAYEILLKTSTEFSLSIEPTIYFFSVISRFMANILSIEPIHIFYFQYIYLIQFFLFFGFYNLTNKSILKSNILLLAWVVIYGTLHGLVQIRFGLANAIFVYTFSLLFKNANIVKIYLLSILAITTHYSSILAIISLNAIRFKNKFLGIHINMWVHMVFITFLLLFKFGHVLNFLPPFLLARLSGYLNENDSTNSLASMLMSFTCYTVLILTPKLNDSKLDALKIYGALGFLPYFLVPDMEILIRLGISLQYLLLPYLFLTFKYKKIFLYSSIPLSMFYLYKIYSNSSVFLSYV